MKKVKYLIFMLGICLISIGTVSAASFKVTANKSTVVVGNSVNVTVSVSGSDAAGWEYCLNYDTSVFSLTSHSSSCVLGGTLAGNKNVTFKLKAKKSGSSTFTLRDASILDDSAKSVLASKGSVTVKAKTQAEIEASYSTNANLSSLRVVDYVISPEFDKDTLEYSLEVENEVDSIIVKASRADSSASISGTGDHELTEGTNKISIVVTAEKGNKKTYVINVTRKELNPIHVEVDGFEYTVVRKADALEAPTYYSSTEIEIDGEMVPAFNSDITGYTLVGLKDENGNIDLYSYNEGKYSLYKQVGNDGFVFVPMNADELLNGFDKTKNIEINEESVKAYYDGTESDYVLVYGMNAKTGKSAWYTYDTLEGTFQRYIEKIVDKKESNDTYFLLTIVFGGVAGLALILLIALLVNNSKIRKKNDKLITMLQMLRGTKKEIVVEENTNDEDNLKRKQIKKDIDEVRKSKEEFLETTENEIVEDDVELEESILVKKNKRGGKKKD